MRYARFLDFTASAAKDPRAPYAVLPIPYERTVSYGCGTAKGPAAILAASTQVEFLDEELGVEPARPVQTLPAMDFKGLSEKRAIAAMRAAAAKVLGRKRFLLSLGGEHSVTSPLVAAAKDIWSDLTVLQFDAHADLRDEYQGSPYSHASVMKRIVDMGLGTVQVGIRSLSGPELELIRAKKLAVFWARDIAQARDDAWMDAVLERLGRHVYVTFDIDGLDPSIVPGTGTPEPGGLAWYPVLRLLRRVFTEREVVAADIVEVAPVAGSQVSEFVGARLAAKMIMYHQCARRG
ncbi:MAG: agmatinase [Kiritimatiellae bacterium]|nr:agmatinase [Kiritimatiellia bacterium]